MNGAKNAINKAKEQVASTTGTGQKRRKKDALQPIITTESQKTAPGNPYR